jgi:hypothetical protein
VISAAQSQDRGGCSYRLGQQGELPTYRSGEGRRKRCRQLHKCQYGGHPQGRPVSENLGTSLRL